MPLTIPCLVAWNVNMMPKGAAAISENEEDSYAPCMAELRSRSSWNSHGPISDGFLLWGERETSYLSLPG